MEKIFKIIALVDQLSREKGFKYKINLTDRFFIIRIKSIAGIEFEHTVDRNYTYFIQDLDETELLIHSFFKNTSKP